MKASRVIQCLINTCAAATILTGCGDRVVPDQILPAQAIGASAGRLFVRRPSDSAMEGKVSWMAPEAKSEDLLYVANSTTVTVYSYPEGRLKGTLNGFYAPQGECVDEKGHVFITDFAGEKIFEYEHGSTKRIATLQSPPGAPVGCSVDPTTGNLAVLTLDGLLAIYKGARGTPMTYTDSDIAALFWGSYDSQGNIFVDGQNHSSVFEFAELPKGKTTFSTITLDQRIGWPGGVQTDGKDVVVGDQDTTVLYRFVISGSHGTKVGSIPLGSHAQFYKQFWIQGHTLTVPNEHCAGKATKVKCYFDALFFAYPAGGAATKKITNGVRFPAAAVVSVAAPPAFRRCLLPRRAVVSVKSYTACTR